MQAYESIFIIRPSLSDEETQKLVEKMKGVVEKHGGTVLKTETWGRKKLAYEVKRERKGTYAYMTFQAGGATVSELERAYRLEDSVIKFLTVRLEPASAGKPGGETKESDRGRVQ